MEKLLPLPPISLNDALSKNIKGVAKGKYELNLPNSFYFNPRIFGGLVMSMVQQAVKNYFGSVHNSYEQPDILGMQCQFFRLLLPSMAKLVIKDVHLGKVSSTLLVTVSQKGKDCMMVFVNIANLSLAQNFSFKTNWKLDPPSTPVSVSALAVDADPRWISYLTPYHPQGFRRLHAHIKFFVPLTLQEPHIRDHWITPSSASATFTNETLGFVLDVSLPIMDNFYPEKSIGGQAATIAAGLEQKKDREEGVVRELDVGSASYAAPAILSSLAVHIEIRKRLPPGGTKWLFLRALAKQIENGRMSTEVLVFDEDMDLVASSQQLNQVIDISRSMFQKQKL